MPPLDDIQPSRINKAALWNWTTTQFQRNGVEIATLNDIALMLPTQVGQSGKFLTTNGSVLSWATVSGTGTVTTLSVVTANGVSGSVSNPTTTPAITLTLGAITPSSVAAVGTVTGSNLSGTNTGDQVISDATLTTTDITTNNVSTTKHGFAPKAPNDATKYLDGTGNYSVPAGGGGGSGTVTSVSVVTANGVSGSVATATTTPAITLTLGAITPTSITFSGETAFNHYLEGTYTPAVTVGGGSIAPQYSTAIGRYARIGRYVFVDVNLEFDGGNEGSGAGIIQVSLPPITSSASTPHILFPCGYAKNSSTHFILYGLIAASDTVMTLGYFSAINNLANLTANDQNSTTRQISLKFFYEV